MMRQVSIRSLSNISRAPTKKDFFGILNITSKDIAGAYENSTLLPSNENEAKYSSLKCSRSRKANEEDEDDLVFGQMRRDIDNQPKYHGQYEPDNDKALFDTIDIKQMFANEQSTQPVTSSTNEDSPCLLGNPAYRISEVQASRDLSEILNLFRHSGKSAEVIAKYSNVPPLTYFFDDGTIASGIVSEAERSHVELNDDLKDSKKEQNEQTEGGPTDNVSDSEARKFDIKRPQLIYDKLAGPEEVEIPLHELDPASEEFETRLEKSYLDSKFDKSFDEKFDVERSPKSKKKAMEHLEDIKNMRKKPESKSLEKAIANVQRSYPLEAQLKLDSKGMRNYKHQVPDWYKARRSDILDYLEKSILYHNYNILAINKPYGLSSHSEERGKEIYDLNGLMNDLVRSRLRINELYLAHRLDKTTTGVLVFATNKDVSRALHKKFRSDDIKKTYHALVKGIPDPDEGVIDIPIGEMNVSGKIRMCPVPDKVPEDRQLAKHYVEARRAITEYKTLEVGTGPISLVEVKTRSGVKHQIRCHLGFCLNNPILGDSKYTYLGRLAPQKLPDKALRALRLRQEKVRTLPIHLHASTIMIPDAKPSGEPVFINAPMPRHFVENMKALKLNLRI